jgi:DNA-binding response OmpR family regulator
MTDDPGRLLLLAEDEALLLMDLEATLVGEGFKVLAVSNGTRALSEINSDAARFAALVTDIRLGKGPDGWEVGQRMREVVATMPVVYMSGDSAPEWAANGVPESVMLHKPFVHAQLITALATLLNQSSVTPRVVSS